MKVWIFDIFLSFRNGPKMVRLSELMESCGFFFSCLTLSLVFKTLLGIHFIGMYFTI